MSQEILEELKGLLASKEMSDNLRPCVGINVGLLKAALKRKKPESRGISLKGHFKSLGNYSLQTASGVKDQEESQFLFDLLTESVEEVGGILETSFYLDAEMANDLLEVMVDEGYHYGYFNPKNLDGIIQLKKTSWVDSTSGEPKEALSIRLGKIQEIGEVIEGRNPQSDSSVLVCEDELVNLSKEAAIKSRMGFDKWRTQMTQTSGENTKDQTEDDLWHATATDQKEENPVW